MRWLIIIQVLLAFRSNFKYNKNGRYLEVRIKVGTIKKIENEKRKYGTAPRSQILWATMVKNGRCSSHIK